MTVRIPSSLKWLMTKYQRQSQSLANIEEQIYKLQREHSILKNSVLSLEKVIEMHEVPISAQDIPQLRKNSKQTSLSYGLVTKLIYQYLGSLPTDRDATVTEIFSYCMDSSNWDNFESEAVRLFRKAVRKRLQNMAYQGSIIRTQLGSHHQEARYKLK